MYKKRVQVLGCLKFTCVTVNKKYPLVIPLIVRVANILANKTDMGITDLGNLRASTLNRQRGPLSITKIEIFQVITVDIKRLITLIKSSLDSKCHLGRKYIGRSAYLNLRESIKMQHMNLRREILI